MFSREILVTPFGRKIQFTSNNEIVWCEYIDSAVEQKARRNFPRVVGTAFTLVFGFAIMLIRKHAG